MDVFGRLVARVGAASPSGARPLLPHRFEERPGGPAGLADLAETTVERPARPHSAAGRQPDENPPVVPAMPSAPIRAEPDRPVHDATVVVTTAPAVAAVPPPAPRLEVAPSAPRPVPPPLAPVTAARATPAPETPEPPRAAGPGPRSEPDPAPAPRPAAHPAPDRPTRAASVTPIRGRDTVAAAPVTAGPHRVSARPVTAAPARSVPRPAAATPTVVVTIGRVDIRPPQPAVPAPAQAAPAAVPSAAPARLTLHEYLRGTGTGTSP